MVKKLIRLVAVVAVMCGAVASVQIATSTQAQASCTSKGHPHTIVLRTFTNTGNGIGPIVAREIPTKGTCNGNGAYGGRLAARAGWTPYLLRKQGNRYFRVRKGNGSFSWKAGTKQSALFFCAIRNRTQRGYCGNLTPNGETDAVGFTGWKYMIKLANRSPDLIVFDRGF